MQFGEPVDDEPIYESFQDVEENAYEPIGAARNVINVSETPPTFIPTLAVTATATANLISPKPELKPKPKNLPIRKMVEPLNQGQQPKRVKAIYNFKGTNNDELCFNKGDIITVTQVLDGGWWEGTLSGKTGWFPSNYVKELKTDFFGCDRVMGSKKGSEGVKVYKRESMQYYHSMVLQNVIETEKANVQEMTMVLQTYIQPLQNSGILTPTEYSQLVGNLEEIITFQNMFLTSIEECVKNPPHQRRVGGAFIKHAPRLKELYLEYCANHPRAAAVVQNKRDELNKFIENAGTTSTTMTLTSSLYKPFTRLDRYPSLLKELERHIEESHVDRGDTQRAIAVYKDIANACMEVRKLKEMEYEILTSAIKGWEGEEIAKLGEVIHLSQVQLHTLAGDKHDRIFVLFPSVLVMLSMSPRLSGYQYEGQLPLSGMNVIKCDDEENYPYGMEISGNMIEKIIVTCLTASELNSWLDALKQQVNITQTSGTTKPQSLQISTSQPSISLLTQAKTALVTHSTWSMSCLRPSPPLRQHLVCKDDGIRSPRMGRKPVRRKPDDPRTMEEDAVILKVIEAYCTSAKTRHTVNSSLLTSAHVLIAEEEKIFIDDAGDPTVLQEKTLVDTVYSLRDQIKALEQEQKKMRRDLEDETKARKQLENRIKKFIKSRPELGCEDNT